MSVVGNTAITSGLPDSLSEFFRDGAAFTTDNGTRFIATYIEKPLQSGYANDQNIIANTGAVADISIGRGRIVLIGFRPQHRGQTYGTYKLLFNSVLLNGLL